MVFNDYTKRRILFYHAKGYRAPTITTRLGEEGIVVSRRGVSDFLLCVETTGSIARRPGGGRPSKQTDEVKETVENAMRADDETTVKELREQLTAQGSTLSQSSVLHCRRMLGWTVRGSAYCQMIREANKGKRLEWATKFLHEAETGFLDVIFSEETSIQMESHRRFCCRKRGDPPKNKPRAEHPVKVHVWGSISMRGPTGICVFEGKMDAAMYVDILKTTLKPFIDEVYPNTPPRFMQDNDPKHTSRLASEFFAENGINWWKTPAESPDCNPIENLWHELKEYLRREVKPDTKQRLIDGIHAFWRTVDVAKCTRYIRHLRRVLPRVIELKGAATGF